MAMMWTRLTAWIRHRLLSWLQAEGKEVAFSLPVGASQHGCAEVYAHRLVLASDGQNPEAYAATLAEFVNCGGCSASVISELVCVVVQLLRQRGGNWRAATAARLEFLLDLEDESRDRTR